MLTEQRTKEIFRDADIEGLIEGGAPDDEYDSEALEFSGAVSALPEAERTEEALISIISLIWARSFNRGEDEIEMRLPAFTKVVQNILGSG